MYTSKMTLVSSYRTGEQTGRSPSPTHPIPPHPLHTRCRRHTDDWELPSSNGRKVPRCVNGKTS